MRTSTTVFLTGVTILVVLVFRGGGLAGDREWEPENDGAPQLRERPPVMPPIVLKNPCRLYVNSDSLDHLLIRVEPDPDKPMPLAYDLVRIDSTLAVIHLYVRPPRVWYPTRFEPPGRDFRLYVVYSEYSHDTAEYRIRQPETGGWETETIRTTGFVKLVPAEKEDDKE
jgi:hypothetical protein